MCKVCISGHLSGKCIVVVVVVVVVVVLWYVFTNTILTDICEVWWFVTE